MAGWDFICNSAILFNGNSCNSLIRTFIIIGK